VHGCQATAARIKSPPFVIHIPTTFPLWLFPTFTVSTKSGQGVKPSFDHGLSICHRPLTFTRHRRHPLAAFRLGPVRVRSLDDNGKLRRHAKSRLRLSAFLFLSVICQSVTAIMFTRHRRRFSWLDTVMSPGRGLETKDTNHSDREVRGPLLLPPFPKVAETHRFAMKRPNPFLNLKGRPYYWFSVSCLFFCTLLVLGIWFALGVWYAFILR
jgi:hypothetical protein